jgi:arylsulfatase
MDDTEDRGSGLTRRDFLAQVATGAAATALLGAGLGTSAHAEGSAARTAQGPALVRGGSDSRYNIIFVFTDQERYFRRWPAKLSLPGHERLQRTGVTFHNHYCPAVMCTSSRSVLMTGLQTADNRMFENSDAPWIQALSTKIPTLGHMLRKAGLHRVQGQVASQQGFRKHQSGPAIHHRDGRVRLRRLRLAGRSSCTRPRRLQV